MIGTERLREIERQRDRERERDTARQTDRDRQTERQTEKQTETDREERLGVKEYLACLKHADDELGPPDCTQVTVVCTKFDFLQFYFTMLFQGSLISE